jgi:putative FmdB family regulatory protein
LTPLPRDPTIPRGPRPEVLRMPIYEYRCTSCGHTLEVIQKFNDKPLKKCTECSGALEKLISRSAFQLKGGGWYNEGYRGHGASSSTPSTPTPSTDSVAKSDKAGGTKPDGGKKPEGGKKAAAGGCGSGGCGCH